MPVTKKTKEITIISCLDMAIQKKVICMTKELGQVVLWEGAAYDTIGQWTDTDVASRLLELFDK